MTKTSFYEIQFPSDISFGATSGSEFNTEITTSSSGYEQRNVNWSKARNKYNLASAIKNQEELNKLICFFRICKGKAIGFRFKDWLDYKLTNQIIAIADGFLSEFQLIKTYEYASYQDVRVISKPIAKTINVYCNNNKVIPQIEESTGIIKFAEAPAKGTIIKVNGEFDVPVRFDLDYLALSYENYNVFSHYEIPLLEIKI